VVPADLGEVGQRPDMVQVEVRDDDTGEGAGEVRRAPGGESAREVRVVAAVVVAHVHAAVEHDALPADGRHHAALPHLLPRP